MNHAVKLDETSAVGVAVAQFAPTADRARNRAVLRQLATTAAARGAHLVVFPEYSAFFEPNLGASFVAAAEALDGEFVTALAGLAVELGVHIVAGMIETCEDPTRFSNTLVAVDPTGRLVASYRKLHLYDAFGDRESEWVLPGTVTDPETFDVGGLRVGLQTCYDIRFPEVTRRLVDAGATLVLVPAEWVRGPLKEQHWRTLLTARALENTVFVAAADQTPPVGVGASMIIDPMGVAVASLGEVADVAIAFLAPARVAAVRAINPTLALRRFTVIPR
ncbi:carbon-nitrogen hydrolase family protein [Cryobacterium ruanii]|uniref:Carbon-nitrogen hydrolase family protein n=1 Tax=Cryobacterium ruanii TaxID=1259197 RepID=A0A4R9AT65_9MICO|nr:carbon-nitrogen hydrolase family protein [Cryobacterium ruanii]TFD68896.1 carbon-nitrogen hydrolase family protein [Cryobacterium ruanii]